MKIGKNVEDGILLEKLGKGEQEAFDRLFRKYYPMLCAYAHRFVEVEEAEEVVQEVMLWIWENRMTLVIKESLSQYLFKMTYHKALNVIAKKESSLRLEAIYSDKYQKLPENVDYYQVEELTKKIKKAIAVLPESYRETFVMHRFKGMSYKAIASEFGISIKTVDYRIQQALKLLRENLRDFLPFISFWLVFN
ncbi:RNA polymerase sigma-70 factor [Bacteroides fluxus]|uniref:RNA polymerase sigma-70 factor n=1 Tax=Bacteroides fluxus TaxID=626930 RepID=UPI00235347B6|nr:RNA polymerase sigma-70 factor [Bacteroides fluxus]